MPFGTIRPQWVDWHSPDGNFSGNAQEIYPWYKFENYWFNTLRPRQHGRHFADDTFKRIFLNENVIISIKISLKFVPDGPINNIPALVQIMAWRRLGDKPLSEPTMVLLLTDICVTRPQWVKSTARSPRANEDDERRFNHMSMAQCKTAVTPVR